MPADKLSSISDKIASIDYCVSQVYMYLNIIPVKSTLISDSNKWNKICSSLFVIGDANITIKDYFLEKYPLKTGLKYIFTYGILQALFIQQDAFKNLNQALGFKFEFNDELKEIRDLRNLAIGHPTNMNRNSENFYSYIDRHSLERDRFKVQQFNASKKSSEFICVEIIDIINVQIDNLFISFKGLINFLNENERRRKLKYVEVKMTKILPSDIHYIFDKILEAISDSEKNLGLSMLNSLEETYNSFVDELKRRNELPNDSIQYDIDQYMNAISRIKDYLNSNKMNFNEFDARTFWAYIKNEHENFLKLAKEYDDEYGKTE